MTIDSVIDVFAATGAGLSKKDMPAPAEEPFSDYLEQAEDNRIEESDTSSAQRPSEEAHGSHTDIRDEKQAHTDNDTTDSRDQTIRNTHKAEGGESSEPAVTETSTQADKKAQATAKGNAAKDEESSTRPEITALAALNLNGAQLPPATATASAPPTAETAIGTGKGLSASLLGMAGTGEKGETALDPDITVKSRRIQGREDRDPLLARLAATKDKSNAAAKSGQKTAVQDFLKQLQNAIPANDTPAAARHLPNLSQQAAAAPVQAVIPAAAQQSADPTALQGSNGSISGVTATGTSGQTSSLHAAKTMQQGPVLQQPAVQQVAVHISRAVGEGQNRFDISLHPQELGKVKVKLEIAHDGRVLATVAAERPETLAMLRRDAFALEQALQNAGLNTDSSSLQFSLSGEQAGEGFAAADDHNAQGGGNRHTNHPVTDEPLEMAEAPRRIISTSALDITV